jgi:ABC-2 type transport system permease protein
MTGMALHLARYDLRAFTRNRQSRFFTLALPVLFLVIFASVFGGRGNTTPVAGGRISTSVYYVPGIIALGVIAACFANLVASVTAQRERGVLKRRRATPVPATAVIAGRVLTAVVIAAVMAAVLLGIGWAAYGAHVPARTAPALAVTVVTGAACFCCLGYALTPLIRNEDAALPATQALTLPLYFISGVFVPVTVLPHWLADTGEIFPVRHLASALLVAYNPHTTGLGFAGPDLLIVAAWGNRGPPHRPPHVQLAAARTLTRTATHPPSPKGKPWPPKSRPRPDDAPRTEQSRRRARSRKRDSPTSSTPPGGPSPSADRSSARNAEQPSRQTEPGRSPFGQAA